MLFLGLVWMDTVLEKETERTIILIAQLPASRFPYRLMPVIPFLFQKQFLLLSSFDCVCFYSFPVYFAIALVFFTYAWDILFWYCVFRQRIQRDFLVDSVTRKTPSTAVILANSKLSRGSLGEDCSQIAGHLPSFLSFVGLKTSTSCKQILHLENERCMVIFNGSSQQSCRSANIGLSRCVWFLYLVAMECLHLLQKPPILCLKDLHKVSGL